MSEPASLLARADGGPAFGAGHLARCLAPGQAWVETGGTVTLATWEPPGGLAVGGRTGGDRRRRDRGRDRRPGPCRAQGGHDRSRGAVWVVVDGYRFGHETASSAQPVRAVSASRVGSDVIVRWDLAQPDGQTRYLYFERADGLGTVLLTPFGLPSGTTEHMIPSQALGAPCGSFFLGGTAPSDSPSIGSENPSGSSHIQPSELWCDGGGTPPDPGTHNFANGYHHRDHLGSLRIVTDDGGVKIDAHDYYPFGSEMASAGPGATNPSRKRFTGHERDPVSGLDYMLARYNASTLGRFLGVDSGAAVKTEPQSFNRYSYVVNKPTVRVDPFGMNPEDPGAKDYGKQNPTVITGMFPMFADACGDTSLRSLSCQATETTVAFAGLGPGGAPLIVSVTTSSPLLGSGWRSGSTRSSRLIPSTITGGTAKQRSAIARDLRVISKTRRGAQMEQHLVSAGRVINVRLNNRGNLTAPASGNHVNIDPSAHPRIHVRRRFLFFRWKGTQTASTRRILAHELGHAVLGTLDNGPGRLRNVNSNENPIVNNYAWKFLRALGFGGLLASVLSAAAVIAVVR